MPQEILLTYDGLHELQAELEHLKTVGRKEVAEKIKVALSSATCRKTGEYDEAQKRAGQIRKPALVKSRRCLKMPRCLMKMRWAQR